VVEAVSYCHTTYGRLNKLGTAADMMRALKDSSISQSGYGRLSPEEQANNTKIRARQLCSTFSGPQYTNSYANLITRVQEVKNDRSHGPPPPRSGWQAKAGRA